MSTTLGAATKLLDEMMTNYSQWHTEHAPTGRKVNSVEEISSLNEKVDLIMSLLSKQSSVDPHDVPLNSLIAQEQVDVLQARKGAGPHLLRLGYFGRRRDGARGRGGRHRPFERRSAQPQRHLSAPLCGQTVQKELVNLKNAGAFPAFFAHFLAAEGEVRAFLRAKYCLLALHLRLRML